jgi:hypothetical protein
MINPIKTPHEMLMEQAGLPSYAEGRSVSPEQMKVELMINGRPVHTEHLAHDHPLIQHFAKGGQPEMGTAQSYEPLPSEHFRDWAAKHLGYETTDRLFGGPRAQSEDRLLLQSLNPAAYALNIADEAKNFYDSAKQNDKLGAAKALGFGVLNALPFTGKGLKAAERVSNVASPTKNAANLGMIGVTELPFFKSK